MPLALPREQRIIHDPSETYAFKVHVVSKAPLTMGSELLLQEMARYPARTKLRVGDIVVLNRTTSWMQRMRIIPRVWEVRVIVTYWAWRLMKTATELNDQLTLDEAVRMLEAASNFSLHRAQEPMIYGHGFPHGKKYNTMQWLPAQLLRRTTNNKPAQEWSEINEEAKVPYLGYDARHEFAFDLEPAEYTKGVSIGRPFRAEESLYHDLCLEDGWEELMEIPFNSDRILAKKAQDILRDSARLEAVASTPNKIVKP